MKNSGGIMETDGWDYISWGLKIMEGAGKKVRMPREGSKLFLRHPGFPFLPFLPFLPLKVL